MNQENTSYADRRTYVDVMAENIRAARESQGIAQERVSARMRALGYGQWGRTTAGSVERGMRRLLAEEIIGLAIALETSVGQLLDPNLDEHIVMLPSGQPATVETIRDSIRFVNDGTIRWHEDLPRFDAGWDADIPVKVGE